MLLLPLLGLALTACPAAPEGDDDDSVAAESFSFTNTGDPDLEGHTPRGFQGQGGGLFAGDNLNAGFPEGDGVQIFLSVDISDLLDGAWDVESAVLSSEYGSTSGRPFEDLGDLTAEEIRFEAFSSALWDADLEAGGDSCVFGTSADGPFECDLAAAVQNSLDDGYDYLQLRFRLDDAGDSDGSQDLVQFFISNSNATEEGIFDLNVSAVPVD
ncbi:MAG: hypothetical protein GY898_22875 [Proteobacteria bacterium]|nr:hypothetical protein [Pseudomonadota bacterium]